MEELIDNAKQELKRVDHLIFVSLKYTRTADVLMNVINRLISSAEFVVDALLKKALTSNKISEIPAARIQKAELLLKLYPDDEWISRLSRFFIKIQKVSKSDYRTEFEYRRNVAMISNIDGEEVIINIDKVTEYYQNAKELISYIEEKYLK